MFVWSEKVISIYSHLWLKARFSDVLDYEEIIGKELKKGFDSEVKDRIFEIISIVSRDFASKNEICGDEESQDSVKNACVFSSEVVGDKVLLDFRFVGLPVTSCSVNSVTTEMESSFVRVPFAMSSPMSTLTRVRIECAQFVFGLLRIDPDKSGDFASIVSLWDKDGGKYFRYVDSGELAGRGLAKASLKTLSAFDK